jgi:hypothetical protein
MRKDILKWNRKKNESHWEPFFKFFETSPVTDEEYAFILKKENENNAKNLVKHSESHFNPVRKCLNSIHYNDKYKKIDLSKIDNDFLTGKKINFDLFLKRLESYPMSSETFNKLIESSNTTGDFDTSKQHRIKNAETIREIANKLHSQKSFLLGTTTNCLHAIIRSGDYKGTVLYPHKHEDNKYVATTSRFEEDYIRVDTTDELESLVKAGYGARMSNSDIPNAPSYITHSKLFFPSITKIKSATPANFLKSIYSSTSLDTDSISKRRKEQSFLRAHLLKGQKESECVICREQFPFDLLVAAHIKKRSSCSINEKLDFDNVAALMCKTGCDDFFEKGYIVVEGSKVKPSKKTVISLKLSELIDNLTGKVVPNWSGSKKYYEWHHKKHS